ncbi:hypothetical protein [Undibacterium sp. TS12]|uniref:hypothetical protein n=1 Tax=Undibacterium sp. TS12 TaxID=2908202 RepID=UPI001F4C67E1|nr:hypothetical protein [Undibacterium sp. TS12]MCH8622466.1 hypothetical protein [Undibacterium sp. TS12]
MIGKTNANNYSVRNFERNEPDSSPALSSESLNRNVSRPGSNDTARTTTYSERNHYLYTTLQNDLKQSAAPKLPLNLPQDSLITSWGNYLKEQAGADTAKARTNEVTAAPRRSSQTLRDLFQQETKGASSHSPSASVASSLHTTNTGKQDSGLEQKNSVDSKRSSLTNSMQQQLLAQLESKEKAPASGTQKTQAAPGPVIDPVTGAINRENLAKTVRALIEELPPVPASPLDLREKRRTKVVEQLHSVLALATSKNSLPEDELGLKIRESFSQAASDCRKLARNLAGSSIRRALFKPEPEMALTYSCMGAMLTELKRIHLTAAAPAILDKYASAETKNMESVAPTIDKALPGASLVVSKSIGAKHSFFGLGNIGGSLQKTNILSIDEDGDANYWEMLGGQIKGGYGNKINGWGYDASGKVKAEFGTTFYETATTGEMVKLIANMHANQLMSQGSAGQRAEALTKVKETYNKIAKFVVGRRYESDASEPTYLNDAKLAKGYNMAKLMHIASAADSMQGNTKMAALFAAAYPGAAQLVNENRNAGATDKLRSPINASIPDSVGYANNKTMRPAINSVTGTVSAGIGKSHHDGTWSAAGGKAGIDLTVKNLAMHIKTAEPAHRLLDPAHLHDMAQTMEVHQRIEKLNSPRLHLYHTLRELMEQGASPTTNQLPPEAQQFYGNSGQIPKQFRTTIASHDVEKLAGLTSALEEVHTMYSNYLENANIVLAKPDRFMPAQLRDAFQTRREKAYEAINTEIWQGKNPQGLQGALKDPEKFVAESYDGLSMALASVGTHLSLLKREIARDEASSPTTDPVAREQKIAVIRAADNEYAKIRELMDSTLLPVKHETLSEHMLLKERALWQRQDYAANLTGSGGSGLNVTDILPAQTGQKKEDGVHNPSFSTQVGNMSISVEARVQNASSQINSGRLGQFIVVTISANAGQPISGMLAEKGLMLALEKMYPGTSSQDLRSMTEEACKQLRGVQGVVADQGAGASIELKLHRMPDVGSKTRFEMQRIRGLANTDSGMSVSVPLIVSKAGVTSLSLSNKDSTTSVVNEIIGPDLSYLMLRFSDLKQMLDLGKKDDASLSEMFGANPRIKNQYLGNPDLFVKLIDKHQEYQSVTKAGYDISKTTMPNEFFWYFEQEPYKRAATMANEVAHFAPGTSKDGSDPFARAPEDLLTRIRSMRLPDGVDWEKEKAVIRSLSSPEQRLAYFESGNGRHVFNHFVNIIDVTKQVNSAAMIHASHRKDGFSIKTPHAEIAKEVTDAITRIDARRSDDKSLIKTVKSGFADIMRPERKTLRELKPSELEIISKNMTISDRVRVEAAKELAKRAALMKAAPLEKKADAPASLKASEEVSKTSGLQKSFTNGLQQTKTEKSSSTSEAVKSPFDAKGAAEAAKKITAMQGAAFGAQGNGAGNLVAGSILPTPRSQGDARSENRAAQAVAEERNRMAQLMPKVESWMKARNIAIVPNNGDGLNCLIISLLQHATKDYGSQHTEMATKLRAAVQNKFPEVGNNMLYSDDVPFKALVNSINKKFNVSMNVLIAQPHESGTPVVLPTNRTGTDDVVIIQKGAHYEAVTMASGANLQSKSDLLKTPDLPSSRLSQFSDRSTTRNDQTRKLV